VIRRQFWAPAMGVVALVAAATAIAAAPAAAGPKPVAPAAAAPGGALPAGFADWTAVYAYQEQLNNAAGRLVATDPGNASIVAAPGNHELRVYWKGAGARRGPHARRRSRGEGRLPPGRLGPDVPYHPVCLARGVYSSSATRPSALPVSETSQRVRADAQLVVSRHALLTPAHTGPAQPPAPNGLCAGRRIRRCCGRGSCRLLSVGAPSVVEINKRR
jgi:hypothetical protein